MTKLLVLLIACTACASAPVIRTEPVAVTSLQGPTLSGAAGWADSAARLIDKATIANDLPGLRAARSLLDKALIAYPNDALLFHYQGYELYREANLLDGRGGTEASDVPLVSASALTKLQQSLAAGPMPETHALVAMVMGRIIGLDQTSGPRLGPQIPQEMNAAVQAGPDNPRVWLLRGIQSLYTPLQYGGGLPIAESQLKRAVALFGTDNPTPPAPSWGKAEAYVWLGQVLQKQNKIAEARAAYNNALSIQRDYPWVTNSLLPSLDKK